MKVFTNKQLFLIIIAIIIGMYIASKNIIDIYQITNIYSYQSVKHEVEAADENTLVLFDVDDTLISTHDVVARGTYYPWWYALLVFFRFPYFIKKVHFEEAYSIVLTQAERILIDPFVKELINGFHKKKSIIVGLTSIETGKFGNVEDIALWRYRMLADLGIHFTNDFENIKFINFASHRGNYPELYNGILCTNHEDKGKVLKTFLQYANITPRNIIFFDDKIYNLESVGNFCKKNNIGCKLFHVRIVQTWPQEWNLSRIFKQIKILSQEKRWVSASNLVEA